MRINIKENLEALKKLDSKISSIYSGGNISRAVAMVIYADIKSKIEAEKDVAGRRFKPLSKRTIKIKKMKGKVPYQIMRDTGELLNSLNYSIGNGYINIGYTVPYAIDHQWGVKKRNLPQRKILPTLESEIPIKKINEIIKDYIAEL